MKYYLMYLIYIGILSTIAFILYGIDKWKAKKGKWRIKEAVLLLTGFGGGSIGALAGMKLFRHKTRHWYFWAINALGFAWQMVLLVFILWH